MKTTTTLTQKDTEAAYYAWSFQQYDSTSPEAIRKMIHDEEANDFFDCVKSDDEKFINGKWRRVIEKFDLNNPEDYKLFVEEHVNPMLKRYERGNELLSKYAIIRSDIFMCNFELKRSKLEEQYHLVSTPILRSAGYEHNTEFYIWIGLTEKEVAA